MKIKLLISDITSMGLKALTLDGKIGFD
jgi:hypothetical protein